MSNLKSDTSKSAKKADLASLKSKIDKLGIGKLETTPVNLCKLGNVLKIKWLFMMNWLTMLMLFRPLILVI